MTRLFLFVPLSPLTETLFFSFSSFFWAAFLSFHAPPVEEINLARRGQLCSRKLFRRAVCLPLWGRFIKEAVGRLCISLGMMTALRRGSERARGGEAPLLSSPAFGSGSDFSSGAEMEGVPVGGSSNLFKSLKHPSKFFPLVNVLPSPPLHTHTHTYGYHAMAFPGIVRDWEKSTENILKSDKFILHN